MALEARALDVAASPYDAYTSHGIEPYRIETEEGRHAFRQQQLALMARAQPVRARLLAAYDAFIDVGFSPHTVNAALAEPNAVHFATAAPGGPAWRWSGSEALAADAGQVATMGTGPLAM